MTTRHASITVVVPTYNEAENLPILIPQLLEVAPLDVLVVDDDSPDGTTQVAVQLQARYGTRLDVLNRRGLPRGLGWAYADGFRVALGRGADQVIGMDADLSHSPLHIPAMLELMTDYDIVVGSRYVAGGGIAGNWPWSRKLLSWGAQSWARMILGISVHDMTSAFRCYRRTALQALDWGKMRLDGFSFLIEILYQAKCKQLRVGEVPILFHDRQHGVSKVLPRIILRALMDVVRIRLAGGGQTTTTSSS